jgi:ribonuclease E
MIKKIIISRLNNIAAIIQQNKVQELIVINEIYQINDIYLGSVQKVFPAINAAFIKLNHNEKSGFIHISDIKYNRKLRYIYSIANSITVNQILLVQILKEPTENKGPRLTTNIHLTGQYLILMPFNNIISIANKIYDEDERSYLRSLGILIKPSIMGLLFKESSNGIREEALIEDLRNLKKQWNFILRATIYQKSPVLIYKDEDIIQKIIRDSYEKHITQIIIDSKYGFKQLSYHLYRNQKIHQVKIPKLQLYKKQQCILEKFKINSTIIKALNQKVELALGAHIFIESSEALTIIDVNSGSFNQSKNSKETILRTNCLAASEIAYQLKIRNINGVIIVDFIDMKTYKDQLKLLEHFNKVLKMDNARPHIVQLSELGLVELTRRRRGRSLLEIFYNRKENLFSKSKQVIYKLNHSLYKKNIIKNVNVNSIFFKKQFTKNLALKNPIIKFTGKEICYMVLFPLPNSLIIPIYLYYSTIGKIID